MQVKVLLNTEEELLFECQLPLSLLLFMLSLVNALVVDLARLAVWFAMEIPTVRMTVNQTASL